jgi:hypothetical protein
MLGRSVIRGRSRLTTLTAVTAVIALAALSLAGIPASAVAAPASQVHWSPCEGGGFECATVPVPLDYDQPIGTIPRVPQFVVTRPREFGG